MKTTLLIAALNEIEGSKVIMPRINREWVDEIILVDGGSTDGTIEFFEEMGIHVVNQKSKGICGHSLFLWYFLVVSWLTKQLKAVPKLRNKWMEF